MNAPWLTSSSSLSWLDALVNRQCKVVAQFEFLHEPIFDSNIATFDVLFARVRTVAFLTPWNAYKIKPPGQHRNLEISRVAAMYEISMFIPKMDEL